MAKVLCKFLSVLNAQHWTTPLRLQRAPMLERMDSLCSAGLTSASVPFLRLKRNWRMALEADVSLQVSDRRLALRQTPASRKSATKNIVRFWLSLGWPVWAFLTATATLTALLQRAQHFEQTMCVSWFTFRGLTTSTIQTCDVYDSNNKSK